MDAEQTPEAAGEAPGRPPLARSGAARLTAGTSVLAFGFLTSVATARHLGPSGKGMLSALSFLGDILFFYLATLGLGDAAIILVGKRQTTLQRALSASIPPLLVTGALGAAGLVATSALLDIDTGPAVLQALTLIVILQANQLMQILNAEERMVTSSLLQSGRHGVTMLGTFAILGATSLGLAGAVLAILVGATAWLGGGARAVRRLGLSLTPRWDLEYLRLATRVGWALQTSYLLMAVAQRADQLVVYSLAGSAEGGRYAVALTVGTLPGFIPVVLAGVTFPRLASMPDRAGWPLTAQAIRIGIMGGAGVGVLLLVSVPVLTTTVFGPGFAGSVAPALVLLAGGLAGGAQWALARAWAARGRTGLLPRSFATSLGAMLALDLLLVPDHGAMGAAVASVVGSIAGLGVCLRTYRRWEESFSLTDLVPGRSDLRFVVGEAVHLLRGLKSAAPFGRGR